MTLDPRNRALFLIGITIVVLFAGDLWAMRVLQTSRSYAWRATADLQRCRTASSQITALRSRPKVASQHAFENSEFVADLERFATAAQIPAERIIRVTPESERRLDDTAFVEKPTAFQVRQVTLQQLLRFLCAFSADKPAIYLRSLRLSAPRDDEINEQWNAEITLSYLMFSPKSPQAEAGSR